MNRDPMQKDHVQVPNGAALASVLAAAIGAFALGVLVILNEADVFTSPALYAPAGGLSGRATFAVIAWLVAWGTLHARWRKRQLAPGRVFTCALVLVALAVLMTFPPVWALL